MSHKRLKWYTPDSRGRSSRQRETAPLARATRAKNRAANAKIDGGKTEIAAYLARAAGATA